MLNIQEASNELRDRCINLLGFDDLRTSREVGEFLMYKSIEPPEDGLKTETIILIAAEISDRNGTSLLGEAIILAGRQIRRDRDEEWIELSFNV